MDHARLFACPERPGAVSEIHPIRRQPRFGRFGKKVPLPTFIKRERLACNGRHVEAKGGEHDDGHEFTC